MINKQWGKAPHGSIASHRDCWYLSHRHFLTSIICTLPLFPAPVVTDAECMNSTSTKGVGWINRGVKYFSLKSRLILKTVPPDDPASRQGPRPDRAAHDGSINIFCGNVPSCGVLVEVSEALLLLPLLVPPRKAWKKFDDVGTGRLNSVGVM